MSDNKTKKTYYIPPDLDINPITSSWFSAPLHATAGGEISMGETFDINMPIHPDYMEILQPEIALGDLVETHDGKLGLVTSMRKAQGVYIMIQNANNLYYTVLIDEREKEYIGYSLKVIDKIT